jgi:hypothetical protein
MKLSNNSKYLFYRSSKEWEVDMEYAQVMYNYFVHGFQPGGFFTALLANDAFNALSRSHPGNTVQALKNLVNWLGNLPLRGVAYGSYPAVEGWLTATPDFRREILEKAYLILPEQDEIMMVLRGEKIDPPYIELLQQEYS